MKKILSLVLVFTSNAFGQWHPEIDRIKSPRDVATGQIKSPRDVASGQATGKAQKSSSRIQPPQPKGMNKADLTEQLSIKSPRDVASGQATGIKANARTTGKQSSGLLTEITFPKVRQQQNCKWELGEYDASKNKKPSRGRAFDRHFISLRWRNNSFCLF